MDPNDDDFVLNSVSREQNELKLPSERDLGVTTLGLKLESFSSTTLSLFV
jgi:hypothetical protein